jgi:putative FmdB family regulatory protein
MPLFDYKCSACGKISEILVRDSGARPVCPECGSVEIKRQLSAAHVMKIASRPPGKTCCGRAERCESPPCSTSDRCRRE